jgi:RecA-family ATPase
MKFTAPDLNWSRERGWMLPRQQVSILCGASGSGKTTLTLQAIQANQRNEPFPILFRGSKVGYVVADRTKSEVQTRLSRLDIHNVGLYSVVDDERLQMSLLHEPDKLLSVALRHFRDVPELLVLDPLAFFIKGSFLDYKAVAIALIELNRLAVKRDITILALHHATKARSDFAYLRPQDRILGSAALAGFSGTQLTLVEPGEKEAYHTLHVVSHTAAPYHVMLRMGDDGWFKFI